MTAQHIFILLGIHYLVMSFFILHISSNSSAHGATEATETFNDHGICETVHNPIDASECYTQTNSSYSCCYIEYEAYNVTTATEEVSHTATDSHATTSTDTATADSHST